MRNKMSIEQLYREHYQDIMHYLYRRTHHAETAKDLAQDTFIKAFNGLGSFKGHSSIRTWLYAIAHHTFINWYRRDIKYQFSDITLNEGLQQTTYELPEHYVARTDTQDALAGQIQRLKSDQQTVLILREFQELSYEEIADILDWTLSKVKSTLYRARMQLKQHLAEKRKDGQI
ncbi:MULTISPECIES: sigma-70 family RNA polymerase sigma factor [Bacillus amyloliquefaciens group]|uniref:sigma-70 family RNA polymerase sigma factor n=1 Tax=Bacillus amyloliquefaciens group TaxID=1938374 RepID=UPI000B51D6F6|nr:MULTISPECIES: sigma-70 family RNA polymerase sigma factor [Bacillus amyloliquefaciens group]ASF28680.1 RNA polymerase sigma70 [Bacillus amyloliquefaciens]MDQ8091105.1 sigma-70 family RNA polymerase sigma factor [Bacillus amyloliquefaciens]